MSVHFFTGSWDRKEVSAGFVADLLQTFSPALLPPLKTTYLSSPELLWQKGWQLDDAVAADGKTTMN